MLHVPAEIDANSWTLTGPRQLRVVRLPVLILELTTVPLA